MTLSFHLKLAGLTLFLLAALNIYVVRRFKWREELLRVSLLTRQIFFVHLLFIIVVLLGMGVLTLGWTPALLSPSPLARLVLAGLSLFWGLRLICQWFVYDARLWRGQRFNTAMHVVFSCLWAYYTGVFALAWWHIHA